MRSSISQPPKAKKLDFTELFPESKPNVFDNMPLMHNHTEASTLHSAFWAPPAAEPQTSDRWLLVDFQNMLRSEGLAVDLKRLQLDPCYAQQCLGHAIESSNAALRACARRLSASFMLDS